MAKELFCDLAAGIAGWCEFYFLRRGLNRKIGNTGLSVLYQLKVWPCAIAAAVAGYIVKYMFFTGSTHMIPAAAAVLSVYGIIYFSLTYILDIEESRIIVGKILKKIVRR